MGKTDIFVGTVMLVFSAIVYLLTLSFPSGESIVSGLGPAFFPRLVIVCMLLIGSVILLQGIFTLRDGTLLELEISELKSPAQLLTLTLLYALFMYFFGFFVATPIFMMGAMVMWRVPKHKAIFIGIGLTGVLYVFFKMILRIPLPRGAIFGGF